jgi:hypothetical protein
MDVFENREIFCDGLGRAGPRRKQEEPFKWLLKYEMAAFENGWLVPGNTNISDHFIKHHQRWSNAVCASPDVPASLLPRCGMSSLTASISACWGFVSNVCSSSTDQNITKWRVRILRLPCFSPPTGIVITQYVCASCSQLSCRLSSSSFILCFDGSISIASFTSQRY